MKMPAAFEFVDAAPLANPAADAFAATIRPCDIGAPLAPAVRAAWSTQRGTSLVAALLVHASLLAAIVAWRQTGGALPAFEEIPVEIVIDAPAPEPETPITEAAVAPPAPAAEQTETPHAEAAANPLAPAQEEQQQQPVVATLEPSPAPDAALVAEQQARAEALRRRAEDAARQKREEIARRREAERVAAEREKRVDERRADERRIEARRAAAQQQLQKRAQERQRVASLAPSHGAGASQGDAFDAASYRQIVARAVTAAVARSCPSSGGGRVVVALVIGASGHIAGASLSGASGNAALDSAAVAAVRRAGPFPAPTGRSSVSVPVAVTCR
jgi:periplasmic protein TonB